MTDKDTYDHDECSHLNRAKRAVESDLDGCALDGGDCDCDPGCKLRDERITTLEAQKATIWDQYQAAVTSIDTLEAAVEHLDEICHTRESRIERLKELLTQARQTFGHGHWDREGTSGANCPQCVSQRQVSKQISEEMKR